MQGRTAAARRFCAGLRWLALAAGFTGGCVAPVPSLLSSDRDDYTRIAGQIDYRDARSTPSRPVAEVAAPRTLRNRRNDTPLKISLRYAIHTALANNHVIRKNAQFLSPQNGLYTNAPSLLDPDIQGSEVLFGLRGVDAALADFDPQIGTSMLGGRNEALQNSLLFGVPPGTELQQDSLLFRSGVSKQFQDGSLIRIGHDWDYNSSNLLGQLFPSTYAGNLRGEYRRPLWAGAGVGFTRVAGPYNPEFGAITGVGQGIVIAQINNNISRADLQATVRNLVRDVKDVYWDLFVANQKYRSAIVSRDSARGEMQRLKKLDEAGLKLGRDGRAARYQAEAAYYARVAEADAALSEAFTTETRLRRLIGLPVNDGTVIRPADNPAREEIVPDWRTCLQEALTHRQELRKQKWHIRSLELQLRAAESLTRPQLDFVSAAQLNGFGDKLLGRSGTSGPATKSGYGSLVSGDQIGWTVGLEFSMPLGFRFARSQVRNLALRLVKSQRVLAAQELEISHELAVAFQNLAMHYANMKSNSARIVPARKRVQVLADLVNPKIGGGAGGADTDTLLRAQRELAEAELAFSRSAAEYNKAIGELDYRKGTLLEHNAIHLADADHPPDTQRRSGRAGGPNVAADRVESPRVSERTRRRQTRESPAGRFGPALAR
ncbi:MAG: TolC family protein [Planctomycetaceae bacterium]